MTTVGGRVSEATRTSRFDFGKDPDPDLIHQWNTKLQLFSLVEVCALPNTFPVCNVAPDTCSSTMFMLGEPNIFL